MKKKIVWGEKKYYSSFRDDDFMHAKIVKQKRITRDYKYLPRSPITKFFRWLFFYTIAIPACYLITKIKFGVKVKGRKNLKKVKTGAILIGNHSHTLDCMFASVYVGWPRRNYFIANKDSVQVPVARFFTKALGALPLPDEQMGLNNLASAIDTLVKKKNFVTIYPEACIWPYNTFLRPLPPASFHYAVKSDVPVIPFAVTYRYAKHNPMKKKPKVNITILEPIYPNQELRPTEAKQELAKKTEDAIREVVETKDNVKFVEYLPESERPV